MRGYPTKTPQRVAEVHALRAQGWKLREIAEHMGITITTVSTWLRDPTGERAKALKDSYRGKCGGCGAPTSGCNGPSQPTEYCLPCRGERIRADSRRWILDSFREWFELFGEYPTSRDWNPAMARADGRPDLVARAESTGRPWPSVCLVQDNFGSWNAGVEAAGFSPTRAGHYRDESQRRAILRHARGTQERWHSIAVLWRDGLTYDEIATVMGMAPRTVRGHLTRMRREGWDVPYRRDQSYRVAA